jgi:hypothetical protein
LPIWRCISLCDISNSCVAAVPRCLDLINIFKSFLTYGPIYTMIVAIRITET